MRRSLTALAVIALAACASPREDKAPVTYEGTKPAGAPAETETVETAELSPVETQPLEQPGAEEPAAAEPGMTYPTDPDARGVRFYQGYETVVARDGDSVDDMAARVGLQGAALSAYNGLSSGYQPRAGDELVLPARPDKYRLPVQTAAPAATETEAPAEEKEGGSEWSIAAVTAALSAAATGAVETVEDATADAARAVSDEPAAAAESAPEPRPEPQTEAEAAPEPAPQPEPAPEPQPASEPAPEPAPAQDVAAAEPAPEPVFEEEAPSAIAALNQPVDGPRFLRPIDAPIVKPFSRNPGAARNDGVDFAAPPGAPVRVAGDGVVALVSQSLGGLGTIVLVRHEDRFLTVYGRVADVTIAKGDRVSRGDVIAVVAPQEAPRAPSLHFEVRRGAESVDPEDYL